MPRRDRRDEAPVVVRVADLYHDVVVVVTAVVEEADGVDAGWRCTSIAVDDVQSAALNRPFC